MVMRLSGKIPALAISFLVIALAAGLFLSNIKNLSVDDSLTETVSINIMDTSKIYVNNYGFPKIISNSEYDMFFSIGFVHAKNRLWQMDFTRRVGYGRLSEIFGRKALPYDRFMKSLNLGSQINETMDVLSKKSRDILRAYTLGVNHYIENFQDEYSFEFGALDYKPELWREEDCIMTGKILAFELSAGFYSDITYSEIASSIGEQRALSLIPSYPDNSPFVLDDAIKTRNYEIKKDTIRQDTIVTVDSTLSLSGFSDFIYDLRSFLNIEGSAIGSNSWARRKSSDPKSPTIFANDPHLPTGLPSKWIGLHAVCPTFNCIGFTVPGVPLFIIGRNDNIAFGVTSMMMDDCDYFIERIDKQGKYFYDSDSSKKEIRYSIDTIKVKGELDHIYYQRFTSRGQIISDAHMFNYQSKLGGKQISNKYLKSNQLTYRWTGNTANDDIIALYKINTARNWNQYSSAAENWSAPALNFTYSDKFGNIGIVPAGFVPIRGANCNPNLANPAFKSGTLWNGIATKSNFPKLYNPSKGFVSSANNKVGDLPFHVSSFWEPSSRAERIEELLSASDEYTVRDAQFIQSDYYSMFAKNHFMYLIPIFEKYKHTLTGFEKNVYKKLKYWDFIMSQNSIGSSIYNVFLEKLIFNTFIDDIGYGYYRKYTMFSNQALRRILELSAEKNHPLFDDKRTGETEMRDYIVVKSFKDAVGDLVKIFSTKELNKWKWGKIHRLDLNHIFSDNKFLASTVSVSNLEVGGNATSINNTEYSLSGSRTASVVSSLRFVADMSEYLVYMSMPGGISGDPLSPYYTNILQIWMNGGYIKIPFLKNSNIGYAESVRINPK